jgi:plasmid stabilization system protein ParE
MNWGTTPEADEDLIRGREWIEADNPEAAQRFLAAARECFEHLCDHPESGPLARLKDKEIEGIRFMVIAPPFNRWVVFYRVRVLYGTQNWRGEPRRFF